MGTNAYGNANWDVYRHGLTNVYLAFNGALASPSNYSATFANIPPGNYGRVFVLADYSAGTPALQVGKAITVQKLNAKDLWTLSFGSSVDGIDALRNQSGYPTMYYMRGLNSWWYTQYNNPVYPAGSTCDLTPASPNTAGPVAVTIP